MSSASSRIGCSANFGYMQLLPKNINRRTLLRQVVSINGSRS